MNFAQKLLKKQFPAISGLQNTVLPAKKQTEIGTLIVVKWLDNSWSCHHDIYITTGNFMGVPVSQ